MTGSHPARSRGLAIWAARLAVAGVFVFAAIPKVLDPASFAEDIGNYQAFPYQLDHWLATTVPMIELLGALCILVGFKRRAGAAMLGALTIGFLVLILSVILRDIDLACGCFGRSEDASSVGWPLFVRDVILLGMVVLAGMDTRSPSSSEGPT